MRGFIFIFVFSISTICSKDLKYEFLDKRFHLKKRVHSILTLAKQPLEAILNDIKTQQSINVIDKRKKYDQYVLKKFTRVFEQLFDLEDFYQTVQKKIYKKISNDTSYSTIIYVGTSSKCISYFDSITEKYTNNRWQYFSDKYDEKRLNIIIDGIEKSLVIESMLDVVTSLKISMNDLSNVSTSSDDEVLDFGTEDKLSFRLKYLDLLIKSNSYIFRNFTTAEITLFQDECGPGVYAFEQLFMKTISDTMSNMLKTATKDLADVLINAPKAE